MKKILSVTQVNKYIKNILELDVILSGVFVQGELSNFKSSGGHFYFTLKDENSSLSCVMFKYNASNLKFTPENGLEVMLFGNVSIYEKTGSMQIYVELMEPYGIGALNLSIEQLKKKLLEKGILNENHKKPIPETITNVALITSPTGAVVHDMIKITKARNNNINLIIIPAIVQGNDAEASIINAIEMTNQYNKIDVIILARGGGSTEDLMPFNTEGVAMAIYYSAIPLISAIGHETDFTISDLVADLRASTPSNAIELCIKESINDLAYIRDLLNTIQYIAQNKIESYKVKLFHNLEHPNLKNPLKAIYDKQLYFQMLIKNIENLSPMAVLSKGFAIVHNKPQNKGDKFKIELENEILSAVLEYKQVIGIKKGLTK